MNSQSESVNVQKDIRTVRDDIRKNTPRLRTIHDPWIRNAMALSANPTR
jgi:hypothetical protein